MVGLEFILDELLIVFTSKVLGIHAKSAKVLNGIDLLGFEKGLLRLEIIKGSFECCVFVHPLFQGMTGEETMLRVEVGISFFKGGFNITQFGPEVQGVFLFALLFLAITPNPVGNGGDEYVDKGEFHGLGGNMAAERYKRVVSSHSPIDAKGRL